MPIPPFDPILNVLPPHLGNPAISADLSPYLCTMQEVCDRFATTNRRKEILAGFLRLRGELFGLGIEGFQWLDGSFLEDIEAQQGRDPGDMDVITFIGKPLDLSRLSALLPGAHPLLNNQQTKKSFSVDHFVVPLGSNPNLLVEQTRYWCGLFSHRRGDGVWKGMLRVDLIDPTHDHAADLILRGKP